MTPHAYENGAEPFVQLFVLSCERKDFCRDAVASAVAQNYGHYEVIVSDNSKGDDVADMLEREFPDVKLIRRRPALPALDHFNCLIEECQAPLMVMFHDDDVLAPDYVKQMVELFVNHPHIAAAGCNANLIRDQRFTREPVMGSFHGQATIKTSKDLVEPYLSLNLTNPAPFPGYMYRTQFIKGLKLDARKGGKYADVSFLCDVVERAAILWTADCLFNYRLHSSNDSRLESIPQRLSWLRHIQKITGLSRRSQPVLDYKFIYWRRWLQQNSAASGGMVGRATSKSYRYSVGQRFVIFQGARIFLTRLDIWRRAYRALQRARGASSVL
jgi:glycosyltransferase involved in cell wall biosynthesis